MKLNWKKTTAVIAMAGAALLSDYRHGDLFAWPRKIVGSTAGRRLSPRARTAWWLGTASRS